MVNFTIILQENFPDFAMIELGMKSIETIQDIKNEILNKVGIPIEY